MYTQNTCTSVKQTVRARQSPTASHYLQYITALDNGYKWTRQNHNACNTFLLKKLIGVYMLMYSMDF